MTWLPEDAAHSGGLATVRGRILANMRRRRSERQPLAWTERAIWMTAGLAMGLGVIALAMGIVRWLGGRGDGA